MVTQNTLEAWLTWMFSPTISAILVTCLVALLSPVLVHLYIYRKSSAAELPSFLLLGPSGAGKTSLLTLLATGSTSTTHTSQEPQSALCKLPSGSSTATDRYRSEHDTSERESPSFLLLDTPGHGKLRHHAMGSLTSRASLRGLVFVVDSAALSSPAGLTEAAEYLHDVLLLLQKRHTQGKTSKTPAPAPVLVAANKQDVFTSLPQELVRARLEEEITRVRMTRSKGLLDSGVGMGDDVGPGADEEGDWLGEYGAKNFGFRQMEEYGVEVVTIGGNLKGDAEGEEKVEGWWNWIGDSL